MPHDVKDFSFSHKGFSKAGQKFALKASSSIDSYRSLGGRGESLRTYIKGGHPNADNKYTTEGLKKGPKLRTYLKSFP